MYFVLLNIKYHISPSLSSKTAQKGSLETHTNSKQNEKEYAGPHRSDSNFLYFCVHLLGVRIAVVFSGAKKSRHHKDVWIFVLSEGCDITYRCHACAWNCRAIEPNGFGPTYESPKKETIRMDGFFFGDPYGNRTHITAVKGRCLNLLTNGPGSGNLTRTDDTPGMNRMLYQLSYAAIFTCAASHGHDVL